MCHGVYYAKAPVLLTLVLLTIIPSSSGYIDCRISCRRCHENTEHPAVLEVYCAMCEECKQRRRERIQGRNAKGKVNPTSKPTLKPLTRLTRPKQLVRMRDGLEANANNEGMIRPQDIVQFQQEEQDSLRQPQPPFVIQQQLLSPPQRPPEPKLLQSNYKPQKVLRGIEYPPGCPTPPLCSDSDYEEVETTVSTTSSSTTTTTTTQKPPCPPVTKCRKKRKKTPAPVTCMNPCMLPPSYMCPCPVYPPPTMKPYVPVDNPEHFLPYQPSYPKPPFMPMFPPSPYVPNMFPQPILVPMPAPWPGWLPSSQITAQIAETTTQTTTKATASTDEYFYLHVGLPIDPAQQTS